MRGSNKPVDAEVCSEDVGTKSVAPIYPWKELAEAQLQADTTLCVHPLVKREYLYENDQDQVPLVTIRKSHLWPLNWQS